jgi:hypothetical protein
MLTKLSTFVFVGRNATAVRPYRPTSLQLAIEELLVLSELSFQAQVYIIYYQHSNLTQTPSASRPTSFDKTHF